jgi:RNA polymerase sigma factor for flagellar operon FliA
MDVLNEESRVEATLNTEITTDLVQRHIGYAHAIAADLLRGCSPDILRSDLERAAELGLVQAANSYDSSRGISFVTYAYYRIRGAVYDELRQSRRGNKFEEAANEYMKDYTSNTALAVRPDAAEVKKVASHVVMSYLLSIDNLSHEPASKTTESPIERMLRKERQETIHRALRQLPKRNREVLEGYYFQDLSLKQIGRRMGISESRVSRIHAKALEKMRAVLNALRSAELTPIPRSA